jgi:hypothetical protein
MGRIFPVKPLRLQVQVCRIDHGGAKSCAAGDRAERRLHPLR